jgi:outer membrane protein TolC
MMRPHFGRALSLGSFFVWAGLAACASEDSVPTPLPLPATVSLATTLKAAYEHNPELQRARANVLFYEGALREARGLFNPVLRVSPSVEQREGVISSRVANNENERRTGLDEVTKAFHEIDLLLLDQIKNGNTDLPPCPPALSGAIIISTAGLPACQPLDSDASVADPLNPASLFDTLGIFSQPSLGLSALAQFQQQIAALLALDVKAFSENLRQQGLERIQQNERLAHELDVKYSIYRARLGDMPTYEARRTASFDFGVALPRRRGGDVQLQFRLQGNDDTFRDKEFDPLFGGPGVQTSFRSSVTLVFNQPLMRGRGATSVQAGERAAVQNLKAARERYAHAVSQQTLQVTQRYLDLVAAQSTLELLGDSVKNQNKLLDGIRQLRKAGEAARADVTRTSARLADIDGQIASAEADRLAAQTALAQIVGWSAPAVLATTAEERFALAPIELERLEAAHASAAVRHDLAAAEASTEAARVLSAAARADLRPRLDLSIRAGLSADYFSPFFRVENDEFSLTHQPGTTVTPDPLAPIDTFDTRPPVNYYNPIGPFRSITDRPLPNLSVQLTFQLPLRNRRQIGRLVQAEAALKRNEIVAVDLARVIDHNVNRQGAALARTRTALLAQQNATRQQETTWKATQERRIAGDMSLIDTLTTEQDFTSARLQLVQAQRDFAQRLMQFRFEAGRLVVFREGIPGEADLSGLVVAR